MRTLWKTAIIIVMFTCFQITFMADIIQAACPPKPPGYYIPGTCIPKAAPKSGGGGPFLPLSEWTGAVGNEWNNDNNWASEYADFETPHPGQPIADAWVRIWNATNNPVHVGAATSSPLLLNIDIESGKSLSQDGGYLSSKSERIYGTFTQIGGTNYVPAGTGMVENWGLEVYGVYGLSGTATLIGPVQSIIGNFNHAGGTNQAGYLNVSGAGGSNGTYTLSLGSLTAENEAIGYAGTGTFTHSGGTNTVTGTLVLGVGYQLPNEFDDTPISQPSDYGTYTLTGTGVLSAGYEIIGGNGTGVFNQTGGTNTVGTDTVPGTLTISATPGTSSGTYNLRGGELTVKGKIADGGGIINNGEFNYSGGTLNADLTNNATGTVTLSGAGTRTINGDVVNNGTFQVLGQRGSMRPFIPDVRATAEYTGTFTNNRDYISDYASSYFRDFIIGPQGYVVGSQGDEFYFSGNFLNYSTLPDSWNTSGVDLFFFANPHDYYVGGSGSAYYWDDLFLYDGATLFLKGYSDLWVDSINNTARLELSQYHGHLYIGGDLYYYGGGGGSTVPEPATLLLLGLGLICLARIRRKYKN